MKRFYDSLFYVIFKITQARTQGGGTFSGGGGGGRYYSFFSNCGGPSDTPMSCIIKVYLKLQIQPEITPKSPFKINYCLRLGAILCDFFLIWIAIFALPF